MKPKSQLVNYSGYGTKFIQPIAMTSKTSNEPLYIDKQPSSERRGRKSDKGSPGKVSAAKALKG